jgi:nicotinate-nucleotide adenylyltransferase
VCSSDLKAVALYGGSFDPPHLGHEAIIKALKKLDYIDKIIIMPTFLNPFKEDFTAPADLRLKWLREIFSDDKKIEVSSFEVKQNKKVPTLLTVHELKKDYEKIYLVIGADNLDSLHKWYEFDTLNKEVTFIVATRDKVKVPKKFIQLDIDEDISSSSLRKNLDISKLPQKCAKEIAQYYKEHNAKQN